MMPSASALCACWYVVCSNRSCLCSEALTPRGWSSLQCGSLLLCVTVSSHRRPRGQRLQQRGCAAQRQHVVRQVYLQPRQEGRGGHRQ